MSTSKTFQQIYQSFEKAFVGALRHLSPESCVRSSLKYSHPKLTVQNTIYDLSNSQIHIIAFGKAAISMVLGAQKSFGDVIAGGIASVPFGSSIPKSNSKIQFFPGAKHNLPDSDAEETTKKIEQYLQKLGNKEVVLFLISGGGSALLPAPIEGITLDEKLKIIKLLARNGATIQELNTVRIGLSRVKGGKLARLVKGKAISLIISDIIGDPIEFIASGPTVESNKNQKESASSILQKFCKDNDSFPKNVWEILGREQREQEDTKLSNVQNVIVASNSIFVKALIEHLESENSNEIKASIISTTFEGDATEAGKMLFEKALSAAKSTKNESWNCDIFAGETTVSFPSPSPPNAIGGRNQEMALSFFLELIKYRIQNFNDSGKVTLGIACLGTDGQDGPTDATGAFCSTANISDLSQADLKNLKSEVEFHLSSKTSYNFWTNFDASKNHVKLGKTGHNLMDIYAIFYFKHQ